MRKVKKMGTRGEYRTIFVPSFLFLACEMYTLYTQSVSSGDQILRGIVQYEACTRKWRTLFSAEDTVLQDSKTI